jgi:hypothetical protein
VTKKQAEELLQSYEEIKELKGKLQGWKDTSGYEMDREVLGYLKGILEASDAKS